ncbi:unnamed protein product [Allacma fusca]|uniref:GTPase Era, mitochondrial n=1 Tax=Allacma fusca TaxID=39272 RepID=A0A8J2LAR8_9HEXA|nr:unnamed protein product [Allacma fusca]
MEFEREMWASSGGCRLVARNLFRRNVHLWKLLSTDSASSKEGVSSVVEPEGSRLLKVAIIGVPNAGKSTLVNRLMSMEVCPVSRKPHTTRTTQNAIMLEQDTQLVLADTPGMVNKKEVKKFSVPEEFRIAPENAVRDADIIAVIHSIENKILRNKLDPKVIDVLVKFPTKQSVLIINKIDKIKGKRKLLNTVFYLCDGVVGGKPIPVTKQKSKEKEPSMEVMFRKTKLKMSLTNTTQSHNESNRSDDKEPAPASFKDIKTDENGRPVRGWSNFQEVFLISAQEGNGVENLKNYLTGSARPSPWAFGSEILTDCPPAELAIRIVKSKMLEYLKNEIPYTHEPTLEYWDTNDRGFLRIVVQIKVQQERIMPIFFGGNKLQIIKEESERQLSVLLSTSVDLLINVIFAQRKKK